MRLKYDHVVSSSFLERPFSVRTTFSVSAPLVVVADLVSKHMTQMLTLQSAQV